VSAYLPYLSGGVFSPQICTDLSPRQRPMMSSLRLWFRCLLGVSPSFSGFPPIERPFCDAALHLYLIIRKFFLQDLFEVTVLCFGTSRPARQPYPATGTSSSISLMPSRLLRFVSFLRSKTSRGCAARDIPFFSPFPTFWAIQGDHFRSDPTGPFAHA